MYYHQGVDFQRGRGFGSLFSGLFRSLVPIAKAGANLGKRVLRSDFVKNLSSQALDVGKDMVKNIAADVLSGKNFSEAADQELNVAKKKVGEAIRGSGRKRKINTPNNHMLKSHKKRLQTFNLLE